AQPLPAGDGQARGALPRRLQHGARPHRQRPRSDARGLSRGPRGGGGGGGYQLGRAAARRADGPGGLPARMMFHEGEHLVLRDVRISDVTDAYHAWMNDPEVTRYLEVRFFPHSKEDIAEYVERSRHDRTNVFLAIVRRDDGT